MSTSTVSPADRLVTLPEQVPRLTLGWEAIKWASKYLRQPNGPHAGERFAFVDSQVRFLLHWYALEEDGSWVYHHGVRRLAKGSGKSPFAAVLSLIELCAPVRLYDFDPKVPGGCCGKAVAMPLVQIAATAESQTANTMRMVRAFAPKGSRVLADHGLEFGRTRYNKLPEGALEVLTSSSSAVEGAEATHVTADETEWWLPANGGPTLAATLLDNLTKSGNRMLETCNAWKPDTGSVAQSSWDSWVEQEESRSRNTSKILYDARIAPPTTDMGDEDSLREALEHVYGDCWWADVRPIMVRIWDKKSRPDDSKRKYLNWPTAPEDAWCDPQNWSKMADPTVVVADQEPIGLFFDGSKSRDATALLGVRVSDGHVFTLGVWEPDNSHDSTDQVPVAAIDAAVERAFDRYDVQAFFADVKEWEGFTKVTWPGRYRDKLTLWAVPGGKTPEPIAWDMRTHVYDFTMASELTEAEIVEGTFTHDGDSRTARHVTNARRTDNRWGVTVKKESPNSPDKIDGCVCVIGVRMVWRLLKAAVPQEKKRSGRVW
ncbi:terminase [Nocardia sp. NPDC057227]|uniref:terminase n=1 Tax=Nocardia sp. NPDC057227 TaxID=3346056 RepID=UPI0036379427